MNNSIPTYFKNIQVTVADPTQFDVLCGSKSKAVASHAGNILLSEKVEESLEAYENARNKQERITINRSVIQFMRRKFGSRFLKQNPDGSWSICEEQTVRDKVSRAIRHALNKKKKSRTAPISYTLEDIKNCDLYEDAEDAGMLKKIARVFERQQEILADMIGDQKRPSIAEDSTPEDVSQNDEDTISSHSRSSSISYEDVATFLADIF